ncbi:MFS transporter [Burkholderia ambifaria]|uniref:MFS transporter n=1 Tax=Burkholderia ambifaria TaxID=152480 RepID=UPI001B9FB034|nr:MFS transporter [Burkholderia ambifaria]MBR8257569.1 MFS transporter [Burkholderia ambifaria]
MANSIATSSTVSLASHIEREAYSKVTWRLIPLLFVSYLVAYLDRVNVGFAKLQMLSDLNFSEATYGLGAGIFFVGYALFEVPSNIMLHRVGAKRWIARIMITWGVLAATMMFVRTPTTFYILRFLLGIAEAGFLPGIVLYLTYWYPAHRRGRVMALFFAAIPASGLVGGPLSGWIMESMADTHGIAGWQWMFLLEAIPAIVLGCLVLILLPNRIHDASWLSIEEKQVLATNMKADNQEKHDIPIRQIFTDKRILVLTGIYFFMAMGTYGIGFWLPSIIKATGVASLFKIGLLTAIPFLSAIVGMLLFSRSADTTGERKWHLAAAIMIGSIGMSLSVYFASSTTAALAALSIAAIGAYSSVPLFWALPTAFVSGVSAAAAIAFINSIANVAGFISPYMIGWIKQTSGSTNLAMLMLAVALFAGVLLTLTIPARLVNK